MADAILKACSKCRETKSLEDFYRGGKARYCIPCEKEYKREHYARNAEHIKAKSRAWIAANKDRKAATDKTYREANAEKIKPKRKAYQRANMDRHLERCRRYRSEQLEVHRAREAAYRQRHRELCNERIRQWKKRNPEAIVFYAGKRRAAALRALPAWANLDAIASIYKAAQAAGSDYHVDHTVPLVSDYVCGLHCEANLRVVPAVENLRKNNRSWPDMW